MADIKLSTLIGGGGGHTRNIVLPNLHGTIYAAGTRGLISKSIKTQDYGFVPLINIGRLNTYDNTTMDNDWGFPDTTNPVTSRRPGMCSIVASTGHLIVVTFDDGKGNGNATISNHDFKIYVLDKDTGDILTVATHTASNLDWTGSAKQTSIEMELWEVKPNFFVAAIKDEATGGTRTLRFHGFNYNTSTDVNSTFTTSGSNTLVGTNLYSVRPTGALNNAGTELIVIFPREAEACRFHRYTIGGSSGAWTISGSTIADSFSFEQTANQGTKPGFGSHLHRLSNDDIIAFGPCKTGTLTNISHTVSDVHYINIWDSLGADFTQSYDLMDEVPSTSQTNKFKDHTCVRSFEVATDTYIILTKSRVRSGAAAGPVGYWSDQDGFSHVRAIRVVVDPSDNTIVQTDLGQFDGDLFDGVRFTTETFDGSEIYDWHFDIADLSVVIITKTTTIYLKFTASWDATDMDNSFSVYAPMGPRTLSVLDYDLRDHLTHPFPNGQRRRFSFVTFPENAFAYDHANGRVWCPMALPYQTQGTDDVDITPICLTFDIEQIAAFASVELVVTSATSSLVTCLATNVEILNDVGHGLPRGYNGESMTAVTDDYLVLANLEGSVIDALVRQVSTDDATDERIITSTSWFGSMKNNTVGTSVVRRFFKSQLDLAYSTTNVFSTNDGMVFQIEQLDQFTATQANNYNGPAFRIDNLETDMLYFWSHGSTVDDEMMQLITSEGWWVAGFHALMESSDGTHATAFAIHFAPSSRIEHSGRFESGYIGVIYLENEVQLAGSAGNET